MDQRLADLLALLELEALEVNLFRGESRDIGSPQVFGGQVLGQALSAAARTVDAARVVHSLHAYFLRRGDSNAPIVYQVDRSLDGHSFSNRRVVAIQHGEQIFNMAASFQVPETGYEHQSDMPKVPPPEGLLSEHDLRLKEIDTMPEQAREWALRPRPIEMRPVQWHGFTKRGKHPPFDNIWIKATGPVPDDVGVQQAMLAYASDMSLLDTALLPHGIDWHSSIQMASLDHAMWFHHPFHVDDWLLYAQDSPSASGARGFNRGAFYTRDGKLVATAVQEGLMRPRPDRKAKA
jgi:acyl-CoA thioesterase-2